ncbi:DUF4197 domain-containing protein [Flavobacterium psychrotolerans]|uniref:DUF4197 domain-containing protein n=1 Tax=Flavobacterium psychrotolerans TaxID=2169410 RepID=A0A2U1JRE9_9FLAO|nr:DUF4197 domain-containing protein [Flavobacterium psychrotolerans]PWA07453.1 DUF4197 domain-containing protein [Flavobacterium psychrotolerans]
MKKLFLLLFLVPIIGIAQVKSKAKKPKVKTPTVTKTTITKVTTATNTLDISAGLKEALNKGVTEQVSKLTALDGFYKNEAVKILMPEELQKVDATLRKLGMGNLADDGVKSLNRAAEDAVKEATPIFVNAIKNISITDAKSILLGNENAATTYLQGSTAKDLYAKFSPVVQESIGAVGADVVWASIIKKYNAIPFIAKVNPDITDYVTNKAMDGVFKMIAVEEKNIRTNLNSRTSSLLQQVFALQDIKK